MEKAMKAFAYAHARGAGWRDCAEACADRLGPIGSGLGFVYFTEPLAAEDFRPLHPILGQPSRTGLHSA